MVHIKVTKGLDIPIKGKPVNGAQLLIPGGEVFPVKTPSQIALDLTSFPETKFRLLVKEGDKVKLGQPLAEDKEAPGRLFVAPASGNIKEIRRGLKRALVDIVIDVDAQEQLEQFPLFDLNQVSRENLVANLMAGGLFTHIRQRPFNILANPNKVPRSIFVKAVETAPFVPPAELQVEGYQKEFQMGLKVLAKLTSGDVHLIYNKNSKSSVFLEAEGVKKHTVEGPHPAGNASLHIHHIDPVQSPEDAIWTVNVHDVIAIGYFVLYGQYFVDRIVSIAGPAIIEGRTGYYKLREGYPLDVLLAGRITSGPVRMISGDVLTGKKVESGGFLGFNDYVFCVVPESSSREFLHFFRVGGNKYTFSGAYLSGHFDNAEREYDFTTSLHGEHRPFIDATLYDEVMPLNISVIHLVKAVLAEDYDLAAELGLMEVDSEDFALPSFVCPSKIEMGEIIKKGQERYASDMLK